jgi:hypothetical protein
MAMIPLGMGATPSVLIEEPYHIPEGFIDFPFAYVFDGTNIQDGLSQLQNNSLQIDSDSDFILRHIAGVPTCVNATTGRFNYRNASGSYAAGNPSSGIAYPNNWPVVPEKLYPANHQISFDLYNTSRAFNACGGTPIYTAQIAFMGVKRVRDDGAYRGYKSNYRYRERKYTYSQALTINFAHFAAGGFVTGPVRQTVQLDSYDFELLRISITNAAITGNAPSGQPGGLTTNDFRIMLYDAQYHGTSGCGANSPINAQLNATIINSARPNPQNSPAYQGIWPTPTLVYPAGGQILFDVVSMLCSTSIPQTYNIAFEGLWRIPC